MQKIVPGRAWPLFDVAATQQIEQQALAALPAHALMQRAGLAVARLALALAPHARRIWVVCGPGNNGGDGLEAAVHLQAWGKVPQVQWLGQVDKLPPDAAAALQRARSAGVLMTASAPLGLTPDDLVIDALLGIGGTRALHGPLAQLAQQMCACAAPTLAVDVPTGLNADTGQFTSYGQAEATAGVSAQHTLSLLTLKPGLFTGQGRDACGQVWYDDLALDLSSYVPRATLNPAPKPQVRSHASNKGSFGDVAVVGGAQGMAGAAQLAALAALHSGAGRVYVSSLDPQATVAAWAPDIMQRHWSLLNGPKTVLVCGCGGGDAVVSALPSVLAHAGALVLDADALNAIALDSGLQRQLRARGARGRQTVLTPHPLEAARLAQTHVATVQGDRMAMARQLATEFDCTVVLKGSGSVIAGPNDMARVNPTGGPSLAIAGTGDVLAGMVGARLAAGEAAFEAASAAVFAHGLMADRWPKDLSLTASGLAQAAHL